MTTDVSSEDDGLRFTIEDELFETQQVEKCRARPLLLTVLVFESLEGCEYLKE